MRNHGEEPKDTNYNPMEDIKLKRRNIINNFERNKKKMVYVAGPIRSHYIHNTRDAIDAWKKLLDAGYIPIVPHLSILIELVHPIGEKWYEYDLYLLIRCDIMLRLPGESFGADLEEMFAKKHNIPIYYSVEELINGLEKSNLA